MDALNQYILPDTSITPYILRPLSFEDYPHIKTVLSSLPDLITHYYPSCIFGYAQILQISWISCHHHLCFFMVVDGYLHLYAPPLPEKEATNQDLRLSITRCFEILNHYNGQRGNPLAGTINAVSDERLEKIQTCSFKGLTITPYSMGKDYIYDMEKMISLSGNGFSSKRQERNKFLRTYPNHRTETFTSKHLDICLNLLHQWSAAAKRPQNVAEDSYLQEEIQVCKWTLQYWKELHLIGMVLIVNEEVVGFTFGEALCKKTAYILIEKMHPDFKHASTFIFSEFCRLYWSSYQECNASDDGNCPNLRFTKGLYRPIRLLNKWTISQTGPLNSLFIKTSSFT